MSDPRWPFPWTTRDDRPGWLFDANHVPVAECGCDAIARTVVAAMNATSEPVAWQWRSSPFVPWSFTYDEYPAREKAAMYNGTSEVRPLYTHPSNAVATVERLRAEWDAREFLSMTPIEAADEIIRALKDDA